MHQVDLRGCPVGALTRAAWLEHLQGCIERGSPHHHVSLNAAKWVAMRRDEGLRRAVRAATSVGADGAAIVLASRWLGDPLPERVTGCDLAHDLLELAPARGWRVGLLGARPEVLTEVRRRLEERGVRVVYARDGYFEPAQETLIATQIREVRPQLLLVAMGSPRTEHLVGRQGARMGVPLVMGVGGTFDVLAGAAVRAPDWVAARHLEWAWRWLGSPRARFQRAVLDSGRFVFALARGQRLPD